MNKKTTKVDGSGSMRKCIGSVKFGIEAHQAPPADFPVQPSQEDGLGRMCKIDWNRYTNALRKAALARKAADPSTDTSEPDVKVTKPTLAPAPEKVAKVKAAKARIAATEKLGGTAYTDAIGSDEVQAALEVIAHTGPDAETPLAVDEEAAVA